MAAPARPHTDPEGRHTEERAVDHTLHCLAVLAAAGYAWKLHGLVAGIAVLIGLVIGISVTNLVILAKAASFSLIRVNRWVWVILAFASLAVSGASSGHL